MAAFYLELPFPISANTYYTRNGMWVSKRGRTWLAVFKSDVWQQLHGKKPEPLIGRVAIKQILAFPDTKHRRDLDNYTGKHLWDALKRAGLWADDSQVWYEERKLTGRNGKGQLIIETWEI